jgi:hypothetical protein
MDRLGSGPELPACWISGFYGSGKSSFAKLLGLSLDGRRLPDKRPLADALIAQDHSPGAIEIRNAWDRLVGGIQPVAVVFDVGSKARDDEHIHASPSGGAGGSAATRHLVANTSSIGSREVHLPRQGPQRARTS